MKVILKHLIEKLRMEHEIELRNEDNYRLFNCSSNSQALEPYFNREVVEWFTGENRKVVILIGEEGCLTPNQRLRLKEKIDEIELATGRTYVALTYQDKNTYLSFVNSIGYYEADTFTDFLPFMDSAFESGKLYLLSDLLGESEYEI